MGAFIAACIQAGASLARSEETQSKKAIAARPIARRYTLVLRRRRTRLQDNLKIITGPHGLEEFAERGIVLGIEYNDVHIQLTLQMQRSFIVLHVQRIHGDVSVRFLRGRYAAHLPAKREFDGGVVELAERKCEIDGVFAVGVLENVLFGVAEQTYLQKSAFARSGNPSRHLEIELGDHLFRGVRPVRTIGEFDVDARGNIFADLVFKKFFAAGSILAALRTAPPNELQPRKRYRELALQVSFR